MLEAENLSLERQLFSYQKSIALAHSRGTYVDDTGLEEGGTDDYAADGYSNGKRDYHGSEYAPRSYDYGYTGLQERAFSTDTDYA